MPGYRGNTQENQERGIFEPFHPRFRSHDSMVQVRPGKWKKEILRRVGYKSLGENSLPRTLTRCATYFRSPLGFSCFLEISFPITI